MLSLKQSLIDNQSIHLQKSATTWQEAIQVATEPLVASGTVESGYAEAIIASTENFGPYYILMPGMAMPHARPEDGVRRDGFSLVTLQEPVIFSDGKEVSVLITLAATSNDIHTGIAIPQIVAVFELPDIIQRLQTAKSKEEVLAIIDEADMSAYLS
ncbi:PTS sugar transporter subunit IIA [Carnobacterium gallinarum]|uniref:PTS sugar transporter subunit IIA n=1 Tax=Carnobacterium gallinarum TaxID=2749 RepID=UPI0005596082|nr:PTS sugar transporter subunit IIA [Carnobacterium gallinarum]